MLQLLTVPSGNTFPGLTNNLVDIQKGWVASVRHPMIADEDDINDMSEITVVQRLGEVPNEEIDSCKTHLS